MKIGIDIRALMEEKTTGVQVYIKNLLEALFAINQDNEYVLFANSFSTSPALPGTLPGLSEGKGRDRVSLKFFRYPNKLFMPVQKFLDWPKVDKLLGGIDLFFSPHWRTIALGAKVPLVVTFHDLTFELVPEFFTLRQRIWHQFMDYRGATRRASIVLADSENTKRDLQDLYHVPAGKIRVIYPGVVLTPTPASTVSDNRDGQEQKYFLYFGTFEPRKNIETVIRAYAEYLQSSPIKRSLVLAGSLGWKTKIRLPDQLKGRVKIFSDVSEAQKANLFQNAFALLFLSFYEGFGFPVLEAAAAGVPVIASVAPSLLEISHEFALLVNPYRPSQAANAMLALEEDEEYHEESRKRGLAAAKKFNWDRTARRTLEVFNSLRI